MSLQRWMLCVALVLGVGVAAPASASTITIDFEGLSNGQAVLDYYSALGISFSQDAIALKDGDNGGFPIFNLPSPITFMISMDSAVINVSGGFGTFFSFWYTNWTNPTATAQVWSGLNGTGDELASIELAMIPECAESICTWDQVTAYFAGTAYSVTLGPYVAFDDLEFGPSTSGSDPVPEPASLVLLGTGLAGVFYAARRRRARTPSPRS